MKNQKENDFEMILDNEKKLKKFYRTEKQDWFFLI